MDEQGSPGSSSHGPPARLPPPVRQAVAAPGNGALCSLTLLRHIRKGIDREM